MKLSDPSPIKNAVHLCIDMQIRLRRAERLRDELPAIEPADGPLSIPGEL